MLIDADRFWLMLFNADWCWLTLNRVFFRRSAPPELLQSFFYNLGFWICFFQLWFFIALFNRICCHRFCMFEFCTCCNTVYGAFFSFDRLGMWKTFSYCKKPFQQKPQSLVRPLRLFKVVENKSFILEHSKNMFPK